MLYEDFKPFIVLKIKSRERDFAVVIVNRFPNANAELTLVLGI
jgi:hypothetical protein